MFQIKENRIASWPVHLEELGIRRKYFSLLSNFPQDGLVGLSGIEFHFCSSAKSDELRPEFISWRTGVIFIRNFSAVKPPTTTSVAYLTAKSLTHHELSFVLSHSSDYLVGRHMEWPLHAVHSAMESSPGVVPDYADNGQRWCDLSGGECSQWCASQDASVTCKRFFQIFLFWTIFELDAKFLHRLIRQSSLVWRRSFYLSRTARAWRIRYRLRYYRTKRSSCWLSTRGFNILLSQPGEQLMTFCFPSPSLIVDRPYPPCFPPSLKVFASVEAALGRKDGVTRWSEQSQTTADINKSLLWSKRTRCQGNYEPVG